MKVLITAPPMIGMIDELRYLFESNGVDVYCPEIVQALNEDQLVELAPEYDGWIIGDDRANRRVLEAGKSGVLKAAVKWGVGVDNVDFDAAQDLSIPVTNTPNMFGNEVGDIVMSYITSLARKTFLIDREVKAGKWPKPRGISLAGRTLGLVGFGNTGKAIARRALAAEMKIVAYTRSNRYKPEGLYKDVEFEEWDNRIGECDFIVMACSLNSSSIKMINADTLKKVKKGVRIINAARGALISESDLVKALRDGTVQSVALDVFETEPLPATSELRNFEQCIFCSHNASNTSDAVMRTSRQAISILFGYLGIE